MKILLDIVSVSPVEIAADMFSALIPVVLVSAVAITAVVIIIKVFKKKK